MATVIREIGGIYKPRTTDRTGHFEQVGGSYIEITNITNHGNLDYYILDAKQKRLVTSAGGFNLGDLVRVTRRTARPARSITNKEDRTMGTLKKLSTFARKTFDKDVQNFIKLDWIDQDLEITDEGIRASALHYLMTNKVDMGKVATEEVKEIEETND